MKEQSPLRGAWPFWRYCEAMRESIMAAMGVPRHILEGPMTEVEWLTSTDPARMLRLMRGEESPHRVNHASDRKLRLFAVACAGGPESGGDWNKWGEADSDLRAEGYFSSLDGARYWVGQKVGQHHVHKLKPTEAETQAALLRDIFGNPFKPVISRIYDMQVIHLNVPDLEEPKTWTPRWKEEWRTTDIIRMAQAAYDKRDFSGLPVIADALEEAGCREDAVLRHLRDQERCVQCDAGVGTLPRFVPLKNPGSSLTCRCEEGWQKLRGPHVRGCWVLDFILGKE